MRKNVLTVVVAGAVSLTCTAAIAMSLAATSGMAAHDAAPQASSTPASSADSAAEPEGLKEAKASDCFACHAIDHKVVGPAYDDVAKRYAKQGPAIVDTLAEQVIKGTVGHWGKVPMTAHPDLGMDKARTIVKWILALTPGASASATATAASSSSATGKTYSYKLADGKTATLDFPVYIPGSDTKVTKAIFSGYEQFNSTCNRCHGDDAVGGAYAAPDLRHSIEGGLTWQQFLDTAMAGRESKGMPSWAGFYSHEQIRDIYEYVKGRQLDLVPQGRPPSAQD